MVCMNSSYLVKLVSSSTTNIPDYSRQCCCWHHQSIIHIHRRRDKDNEAEMMERDATADLNGQNL